MKNLMSLFFIRFLCLVILVFAFSLKAAAENETYPEFNQAHYGSVKKTVEKILKEFNSNDTIFVGLGQSPAPVIAMLQLEGKQAFNLPVTGLKAHPKGEYDMIDEDLMPEEESKLFEHFDHFFQDSAILKDKTVVFVDYANRGFTIRSILAYFPRYLQSRYPELTARTKVKAFGIAHFKAFIPQFLFSRNFKGIYLNPNDPLAAALFAETLKPYSEYGTYDDYKYRAHEPYRPPAQKDGYRILKAKLTEFMNADNPHLVARSCRSVLTQ